MNENQIEELLQRRADGVEVSPAPLGEMVATAARQRRRHWLVVGSAAAALAVVAGTAGVLSGVGDGPDDAPVAASPRGAAEVPGGLRAVGAVVGSRGIGVLVPEDWKADDTHCGTPQSDTWVVDPGPTCLALVPRRKGVEQVEVVDQRPVDFSADTTFEVDGVRAQRQSTTCQEQEFDGRVQVCRGVVWFPGQGVGVVASSSTGGEVRASEVVAELLGRVRVLGEGEVPVPGRFGDLDPAGTSHLEQYRRRVEEAGLGVQVRTEKRPGIEPGFLLDVSPAPGTVLAPGDTVTVTAVAEPEGPADEVAVGMNSDARGWDQEFGDPQIRAGETVQLRVGDTLWAYADGKRSRTLAGRLEGDSLQVDEDREGPNHPHSWVATRPGRTVVVLTITADGEPVELGRVTVVVR